MGVRDLQALAAETKAVPALELDLQLEPIDPSLARRVQAVRSTVVNNTDVNSHAARTLVVVDELEKALKARTAEFERMRRNYVGLHSICEEYHEQMAELKELLASGGQPEEMRRLQAESQRIPELEKRANELSRSLSTAESQLAATRSELENATIALQESAAERKKLQQHLLAGQQAASQGGEELKLSQQAVQTLREDLQKQREAVFTVETRLKAAEASLLSESKMREQLRKELDNSKQQSIDDSQSATVARAKLEAMQQQLNEHEKTIGELQAELLSAKQLAEAEAASNSAATKERKAALATASAAAAQATAEGDRREAAVRAELDLCQKAQASAIERAVQLEKERDEVKVELQILKELLKHKPAAPAAPAAAPAPLTPKPSLPSSDELQVHSLRSELEGWQMVAAQNLDRSQKAEAALVAAQRTIK